MGKYRTIVADPPWEQGSTGLSSGAGFGTRGRLSTVPLPYGTLPLGRIRALPVRDLTEPDAHLYLWATQKFLRDSFDVIEDWGFKVAATLVWCKEPRGLHLGGTFGATLEFVHFARRGSLASRDRVDRRWFTWPRTLGPPVARGEKRPYNATKPEAFLDMVESVSPGPYLELFARRQRLGWDVWGNEVDSDVELVA